MKIYLAGPLFTLPEIQWNQTLSEQLKYWNFETFLPQYECVGKHNSLIFETCKSGIDWCDVVLANVDGTDADSGTCWEIGYGYAKGKKIVLYRTDFRKCGDDGFSNLMLSKCCDRFLKIENVEELVTRMLDED